MPHRGYLLNSLSIDQRSVIRSALSSGLYSSIRSNTVI